MENDNKVYPGYEVNFDPADPNRDTTSFQVAGPLSYEDVKFAEEQYLNGQNVAGSSWKPVKSLRRPLMDKLTMDEYILDQAEMNLLADGAPSLNAKAALLEIRRRRVICIRRRAEARVKPFESNDRKRANRKRA